MSLVLAGVRHASGGGRGPRVDTLGPLDLVVEPGEFVAVVGPPGCGKSTLLSLLAGFQRPSAGAITLDGRAIEGPGPDRGVVFEHPSLLAWLDVRDNVAFGLRMRGVGRRARLAAAEEQLERTGLRDVARAWPDELPAGARQRCQIARMLAGDPRLMLLDEPFGALDVRTREQLQAELRGLWDGSGRTAILATSSAEEAAALGTRVLALSERPGRIVRDDRLPAADRGRARRLGALGNEASRTRRGAHRLER